MSEQYLMHYGVPGMKWGVRRAIKKYNNQANKAAQKERKNKIKSQTKTLNKQASFKEKLLYNNATRKKAAKYIIDNNMSVAEATKKAKSDAWRNSVALVAAYSAVAIGTMAYEMRR